MELSMKMVMGLGALILALVAVIGYLIYDKFWGSTPAPSKVEQQDKPHEFKIKNEEILINSADELNTLVKESDDAGVTVFFGHPGCGHCISSIGAYEEGAGENAGKTAFVAQYNVVGDAVDAFGVEGFPTILKFKDGGNTKQEYEGDRSADSFKEFIEK
ncbi:hypothetical protein EPVG_00181 [Emiliania huxleyi virus 201]|nr:hypothetical protein ELVG_00121 [Emiliania huxleyi virus 203]AEP15528.1 hypothetical protein EQVG_00118 [Emiliania huxleyi virus 207]AEP15950.1 hypothetical protein ERVG_00072 [Emiliania huxleyi virus 208]AET98068.1 hypothetical protein EPVG_00181 [Emiliania huxleyi virus 201]